VSGSLPGSGTNYVALSAGGVGAAGTGAHTIVVLMNPTTVTNPNHGIASLMASSTRTRDLICDTGALFGVNDFSSGFGTITGGGTSSTWWVAAISKPAGSAHYRCHLWNYASPVSGSMSHGESVGAANQGDGSTITEIRVGDGDDIGNGLVAVVGVWTSVLSDAQLDTLVSNNLSDWAALSPAALISLQNWNGSTGCVDVVGTSSQTGITGTVSTGANPPGFSFTLGGAVPYNPQRSIQTRDPGETWWLQRDRRDANTVATPANPLPSPLDSAWQAGAQYWHLYRDAAGAGSRTWQSLQRNYISDPSLLGPAPAAPPPASQRMTAVRDPGEVPWLQRPGRDPSLLTAALLENELLGGADTGRRYLTPATHAARWSMPQQPKRDATTPGLLDSALFEWPLLGTVDDQRRHGAAAYYDRREVPQQRAYISDPSFYPTVAPTDPLTLAYGAGGTFWLIYNTAAVLVDRRLVPQQRRYLSDPGLLATALLESPLLGAADDFRRHAAAAVFYDRRLAPQQRLYLSDPAFTAPPSGIPVDDRVRRHSWLYTDRRPGGGQRPSFADVGGTVIVVAAPATFVGADTGVALQSADSTALIFVGGDTGTQFRSSG
jgi:hypothetical protein